jgi:hypothetical protein
MWWGRQDASESSMTTQSAREEFAVWRCVVLPRLKVGGSG